MNAYDQLVAHVGPTRARQMVAQYQRNQSRAIVPYRGPVLSQDQANALADGVSRSAVEDMIQKATKSLRDEVSALRDQTTHQGQYIGTGDRDKNIARTIGTRSSRDSGKGGIITSLPVSVPQGNVEAGDFVATVSFSDEDKRRLSGTRICYWQVIGLTDVQEASQLELSWEANGVESFAGVTRVPLNVAVASFADPNDVVAIQDKSGNLGERLGNDATLIGRVRAKEGSSFSEPLTLRFQVTAR